jgi:hypothetical protein
MTNFHKFGVFCIVVSPPKSTTNNNNNNKDLNYIALQWKIRNKENIFQLSNKIYIYKF